MIFFSCKDASRAMSAERDRELSLFERVSLMGHLVVCSACRLYRRQIALLDRWCRGAGLSDAAGGNAAGGENLTAESRERLRQRVEQASDNTA